MQQLLENEGIVVKNNQVQDFPDVFLDPQSPNRSQRPKAFFSRNLSQYICTNNLDRILEAS